MTFLSKTALFIALSAAPFFAAIPAANTQDDAADTSISAAGDAVKGKRLFNRCRACHNLTSTARQRIGPNLDNLFGRAAGKVEGFKYSKALADADFVWTESQLNEWLLAPRSFLPGNKMAFAGLRKEQDRKDLMAYLREATVETAE